MEEKKESIRWKQGTGSRTSKIKYLQTKRRCSEEDQGNGLEYEGILEGGLEVERAVR